MKHPKTPPAAAPARRSADSLPLRQAPAVSAAPAAPSTRAPAGNPATVALSQQLHAVASALQEIRRGRSGTAVLEGVAPALRPGVQALLFQVLRTLGWAEAVWKTTDMLRRPKPVQPTVERSAPQPPQAV